MDLRHFDDKKWRPASTPRVDHVVWVASLIRKQSVNEAYRIVRKLAVPRFINRKESIENPQYGFYKSALDYMKKHYPYQSKHGGQK